jgi:O-methyltransferase domain
LVIPRLRGKPGFEYLAEHPEMAAIFNDAMTSMSESAVAPVVAAYDFTPYSTIVDVGVDTQTRCRRKGRHRRRLFLRQRPRWRRRLYLEERHP